MIDHISISISDFAASKHFYTKVLAPLGIHVVGEDDGWIGFGKNQQGVFWFGVGDAPLQPMHIAYTANSREIVDSFYAAALSSGGQCNGPPGVRERYHPNYYAAFVLDPDGHNVEAVCHI